MVPISTISYLQDSGVSSDRDLSRGKALSGVWMIFGAKHCHSYSKHVTNNSAVLSEALQQLLPRNLDISQGSVVLVARQSRQSRLD